MTAADQRETLAGRAKSRPAMPRASATLLNRVIWRWHFWAGLFVGPVLVVASVTGAIYIFKDEAHAFLYPHLLQVQEGSHLPLTALVESAQRHLGEAWSASSIGIDNQAGGVHTVGFSNQDHEHRTLYVSATTGQVLGELPREDFFSVVRTIHRRLYAGTVGRVLVELTTCWTIILALTGLWLWCPRSWRRLGVALMPRISGKRYTFLRDLHAIPGAVSAPIIIVVAITGLLYSVVWGRSFLAVGYTTGAFDIAVNPPQSALPADKNAAAISIDEAYAIAIERQAPTAHISIGLPHDPEGAYAVNSHPEWGPSVSQVMFIDQYSGEVLKQAGLSELPAMAQWTQWNYPLHVGSVMGMATKLLWLLVCCVLTAAPITGVWMWLHRRKRGTRGFPKRHKVALPRWLVVSIVTLGLLMPLAGVSMLIVGLVEWIKPSRHKPSSGSVDRKPEPAVEECSLSIA